MSWTTVVSWWLGCLKAYTKPCYKFVGRNDEPRWISDAYDVLGTSTRYSKALNSLVKHVQNAHVPLLGVNQVNNLLRGTGISLNRFTGFAQAEGRVVKERSKDDNYPSPFDLLNLCGLPLPAQYQDEENQKLKLKMELQAEENQKLRKKLDHLINIQIQTSQQINELRGIILQASGVSQTAAAILPDPSIDDRQSIDSLLADDDGQEMEQGVPKAQHQELNVAQAFGADYEPRLQLISSMHLLTALWLMVICRNRSRITLSRRFLLTTCVKIWNTTCVPELWHCKLMNKRMILFILLLIFLFDLLVLGQDLIINPRQKY